MNKIPDKLLINLNILSKIQKNGRIQKSEGGIISLDPCHFYQAFHRYINNDSRKQSLIEINSIIKEAHDKIKEIVNSKYMNQEFSNTEDFYISCEMLLLIHNSLKESVIGIRNLKFTYIDDYNTVSQIDIILLKMNNILKECLYKFNVFNSLLQSKIPMDENVFLSKDSIINMSSYE